MTVPCKICDAESDAKHDWFCPRGKDEPAPSFRTPEEFAHEAHDAVMRAPFRKRVAVLAELFERAMRQGMA